MPTEPGFFRNRTAALVFFARFVMGFLLLQWAYLGTRAQTANALTHELNARVASRIINALTPRENTFPDEAVIVSTRVHLDIKRGCEGFEVTLLLAAAILAFPRSVARRIAGVAIGAVLIYAVNLVRIVSLYYVLRRAPDAFEFAHVTVWQTFLIPLTVLYFLAWAMHGSHHHGKAA